MRMTRLQIPEVMLLEPTLHTDERGYFFEVWHKQRLSAGGLDLTFVQENQSGSVRDVLRGLHYQIARPQGKLVRVVTGEIFDVAVDLRRRSPSFGRWVSATLSADNRHQLYVPPGFAHGFLVMSDRADVVYSCTDYYAPEYERTLCWDDADVEIEWPLSADKLPILSPKDLEGLPLAECEVFP